MPPLGPSGRNVALSLPLCSPPCDWSVARTPCQFGRAASVPGLCPYFPKPDLFVPNSPQPQPCWPLSTQGPHATVLDVESRWWCCGISLRYAWCQHLARKLPLRRWLSMCGRFTVNGGTHAAGRGPASLCMATALRVSTAPWTLCGFWSCSHQEFGAWGPYGWWRRRPPPLRPQRLSSGPARQGVSNGGPPACKLGAQPTFGVAESPRDPVGGTHDRLASGSLPYFSEVRPTAKPCQDPAFSSEPCGFWPPVI
jgi:hypothetical protein